MRCELVMNQIEEDPESEETTDLSWLLYETALTASGFQVSIRHQAASISSREISQIVGRKTEDGRVSMADAL